MRKNSTNNKSIEFLMDGEEFFGKLAECVAWVERSLGPKTDEKKPPEVDPTTYLRLAYWAMEKDTVIERAGSGDVTIEQILKRVADQGVFIDVILWQPTTLTTAWGTEEDNFTKKTARVNAEMQALLHGYKQRITVYMEPHPGTGPGYALHQKLAIFSVKGQLRVVTGGFNIEREYWDTPFHKGVHPISGKGHTLHDTGVILEGPAAADIEEEWLRRWSKQLPGRLSMWKADPVVAARALVKADRGAQPTGGYDITILTTCFENSETDIRATIVGLIDKATKYVFAENFQFCDPEIVRAVCKRFASAPRFEACVVFPDPVCDPSKTNTYLTRIAYAKMGIACSVGDPDFVGFDTEDFGIRKNDHATTQEFMLGNGWFQRDQLVSGSAVAKLQQINDFVFKNGKRPRVQFYCPVRYPGDRTSYADGVKIYVHSKLMIIDREHVIIGSANFGYRSMQYDGELCVHVADAGFAVAVLSKLFPHYNVQSMKEVPDALRDNAWAERDRVKLAARSPGDLGVKFEDLSGKIRATMSYTWI